MGSILALDPQSAVPDIYKYAVERREPPVQSGQISPDGMWRWDGQAWTPMPASTGRPQPPSSAARARGIVVLALLCVAGLVAIIVSVVSQYQIGASTCLPRDFPTYPGASSSIDVAYTGSTPDCFMELHMKDPETTIAQFYESQLNAGDWRTNSVNGSTGKITFERRSKSQTSGTVSFIAHPGSTDVFVRLTGR